MNGILAEIRLLRRSGLALSALLFLLVATGVACWCGWQVVDTQRQALQRLQTAHAEDFARVTAKYADGGDAGYVAYYGEHLTWDEPHALAVLATGQRDLQPYSLRIRMLGLQSQLYESEHLNPELAIAGRFDVVFVLVYLAPLVIIALMHDLVTSERESGRLRLLASLPAPPSSWWRRRLALRYLAVLLALCLPVSVTAAMAGIGVAEASAVMVAIVAYAAFWFAVSLLVALRSRSSSSAAASLLACFVVLNLILPTLAHAAISRLAPVGKGIELTLGQRQSVHQGWDLPKEQTFEKFFVTHPEWRDTPPVTGRFHWKWYYAMHQAGDDAVGAEVKAYRENLVRREDWTRYVGHLLPAAGVQVMLQRLARTDLAAQLAYLDRVADHHRKLRELFYPYVFNEQPFGAADFARLPQFTPVSVPGTLLWSVLLSIVLLSAAVLGAGWTRYRVQGGVT